MFYHDDEYWDARSEARRDDLEDRLDREGVECGDCGTLYDPGHHPATRLEPAWCERDTCPQCGGDALAEAA